jgi:hypothetical protein
MKLLFSVQYRPGILITKAKVNIKILKNTKRKNKRLNRLFKKIRRNSTTNLRYSVLLAIRYRLFLRKTTLTAASTKQKVLAEALNSSSCRLRTFRLKNCSSKWIAVTAFLLLFAICCRNYAKNVI